MQLAWLIRPGGENIEQLIASLQVEAGLGMSLGAAILLHAPPGDTSGAYLVSVYDGAGAPEVVSGGNLRPAFNPYDWPLQKAIDAAEAKFAAAHPLPETA